MTHPRGFALATTFIVAFVVLLAGFTMAALASFNYNLAKECQLRDEAFDAANAGLNYAMQQFIKDAAWGSAARTGDTLPETSITTAASPTDPSSFYVTFSSDPLAHRNYPQHLPWSVNNFSGGTTVDGPPDPANHMQPHQVPPGSALVFVQGIAGSGGQAQTRIIEALLQAPSYKYALVATNSVVTWDGLQGFSNQIVRATDIDGMTSTELGNILVAPFPGHRYFGGYTGGVPPQPGQTPPYGVYLAPGSVVTGIVHSAGPTNIQARPSPPPTDADFRLAATAPLAQATGTPDANPKSGDVIPNITAMVRTSIAPYLNLNTNPASGPVTYDTKTPAGPYTVYTSGPGSLNISRPVITSNTLIDAGGRNMGGQDVTVTLGDANTPVQFAGDYTLTVVNGYLNIPGGIVGQGLALAHATVIVLPVPFDSPVPPDTGAIVSQIAIFPNNSGGMTGAQSSVSILATGDLYLGSSGSGSQDVGVLDAVPWELDGIVCVYGTLTFHYGDCHVHGLVVAEDPWSIGLGDVFIPNGAVISYSPEVARASWLGQAVAGAAPGNGMYVVYWRDVGPEP